MNKKSLLITSMVCIIPVAFGLSMLNEMPLKVAVHWDSNGVADNYQDRLFAVVGLPLFFVIINVFLHMTLKKTNNCPSVLREIGLWICPTASVFVVPTIILISVGYNIPISLLCEVLISILIIICGNYFPQCNPNGKIGLRFPWLNTMNKWKKAHRATGYMWVVGGILMAISSFLHMWVLDIVIFVVIAIAPVVYSFIVSKTTYD